MESDKIEEENKRGRENTQKEGKALKILLDLANHFSCLFMAFLFFYYFFKAFNKSHFIVTNQDD